MKGYMREWRSYNRFALPFLQYALVGVAVFLPWRSFFSYFFILAAAAIWLLFYKDIKASFSRERLVFVGLLCSIYLVEVLGMIHTENVSYGLHRLESKLSLLAFPLIVFFSGIGPLHLRKILLFFTGSTIIACIVCVVNALWTIFKLDQPITEFFTNDQYSNLYLTEPLRSLHPTYLSLFICLSMFVIVRELLEYSGRKWLLLILLFLLLFGFQLASRAGIAALLVTLIIFGFWIIGVKRKAVLALYCVALVTGLVLAITQVPQLRARLIDAVLVVDITQEQANSVSYHLKSWSCSVESWLQGNILFGHGSGDEVLTLSRCYDEHNWVGYGHDAHNEFLSSLVKHGLIGFTVMLIFFFYPYFLAVKHRHVGYIVFLTTAFLCFMSESMLRGLNSLVYFSLFNTLFLKDLLITQGLLRGDGASRQHQ